MTTPYESEPMLAPVQSLFDLQSTTDRAERLVKAAIAAGADAVAVRSVSQSVEVRDGSVEESQRSEGDDVGLRVLVGRKQAVVSTNDIKGDVPAPCRARGGDGARRAGRSSSPGSPIRRCSTQELSRSRSARSAICRRSSELEDHGAPRRGGRVLR